MNNIMDNISKKLRFSQMQHTLSQHPARQYYWLGRINTFSEYMPLFKLNKSLENKLLQDIYKAYLDIEIKTILKDKYYQLGKLNALSEIKLNLPFE